MEKNSKFLDPDNEWEDTYGTYAVQAAVGRLVMSFSRVELAVNILHTLLCKISNTNKGRKIKKIEEKIRTCREIMDKIELSDEIRCEINRHLSLCHEIAVKRNWLAHGTIFFYNSSEKLNFKAFFLKSDITTSGAYGEFKNILLSIGDINDLFNTTHTTGSNLIDCIARIGHNYNFWIDQTTP